LNDSVGVQIYAMSSVLEALHAGSDQSKSWAIRGRSTQLGV